MLTVVIFFKRLSAAKSRLVTVLSPVERANLARRMLLQVIDAAIGALGVGEVIVVSPEPRISSMVNGRDVRLLKEPEPTGLNAAALFASAELALAGTPRALFLPADLPWIRSEDIQALIEAHSRMGADIIVPSLDESGTNGLMIELPLRFPLAFGPDSFNRHLANAARFEHPLVVHRCGYIGVDIDQPDDLRHVTCGLAS